jgi:DNA-binding NtrC family response regulator
MLVVLNEKGVITEDEIPDKYFKNSDINKTYYLEKGLNLNQNDNNINNIKKHTEIKTAIDNSASNNNIGGKIDNHNNNNNNLINTLDLSINPINLKNEVEQFELNLIKQALEISNGVKDKAAKILGINRTTLIEKLKRYRSNNLK